MPYTKYTNGITHGYWHNYEYRHLLRSPCDYREWKKLKHYPSNKWWNAKYRQIYFALVAAGLEPSGFTMEHTKIIDKLLRFNGKVVAAYHGDGVSNEIA